MKRVVFRGLLAHKLRLALTALAIVLGVTFISGTLVLTDTLHNTFNTLFGHIYQNVDFEIRGKAAFSDTGAGASASAVRKPVPQSIATTVRQIPGVEYADGTVSGYAAIRGPRREGHQQRWCSDLGVVVRRRFSALGPHRLPPATPRPHRMTW